LTTEREKSLNEENVQLLGLDHPLVSHYIETYQNQDPQNLDIKGIIRDKITMRFCLLIRMLFHMFLHINGTT
jgi:hypothetical protein